MQYSKYQCNTVQNSAIQYIPVQYSKEQCNKINRNKSSIQHAENSAIHWITVWYSIEHYNIVQNSMIQYSTEQYSTKQCNTEQNSAIFFRTMPVSTREYTQEQCRAVPEFLKVMVSQSCDRQKKFWFCPKSWDLYVQTKNLCILTSFTVFSSCFTHIMWFLERFLYFSSRKISKLKLWPSNKIYFYNAWAVQNSIGSVVEHYSMYT